MKQKMNRDQPLRMAGKQKRLKADRAEKFSSVRGDNLSSRRRNSADGADFAFVRNLAGIRIKVCCAAAQLKLCEGGWVQVSLEFTVQDRQTKEGKNFKSQSIRISNIAPLWGMEILIRKG